MAFTICMTGISGSGKSTIAYALEKKMRQKNIKCQVIDGDELRGQLGNLFGYTREERMKNSNVVRVLAKYLNNNEVNTIIAIVAPYEEMRQQIRDYIGSGYIEVYVKCTYEVCAKRDVKGYYKKVLEGEMNNLNGANDLYEIPESSEIVVDTEKETIDESVDKILQYILEETK